MNRFIRFFLNILLFPLVISFFPLFFPFSVNAAGLYTPRQRFGADLVVQSNATDDTGQDMPHQVGLGWAPTHIHFRGSMDVERVINIGTWYDAGVYAGTNSSAGLGYQYSSYAAFKSAFQYEIDNGRNSFPNNTVFILGNEIGYTPGVEDYSPAAYVDRFITYSGWVNQLGQETGKTFKMGIGGNFPLMNYHYGGINGTEYVRQVLANYQARTGQKIPAQVFTIHPYNFGGASTDMNVFKNQVKAFRQMMKDMGYQDRELWITEWGNLANEHNPGSSLDAGAQYLRDSVTWLMEGATDSNTGLTSDEKRLVQRWGWWPFNWGNWWGWHTDMESRLNYEGQWSYMYNSGSKTLSVIGQAYKDLITKYAPRPTPPPGSEDMKVYFPFDEGTGTTITDYSGNDNNGNGSFQWIDGKYGKGVKFDTNNSVKLPKVIDKWNRGTIAMWVKLNRILKVTNDANNIFFSQTMNDWHDGVYDVIRLFVSSTPWYGPHDDFRFGIFQKPNPDDWASTSWNWVSSGIIPEINRWYHLTATWKYPVMKIYINGELKGTTDGNNPIYSSYYIIGKVPPASYSTLGSSFKPGTGADAIIDDFRIYNRELSDTEVNKLANEQPATPTPSPTSVSLPGDLNKNNKVDIFDYNLIVQNFGNTTCGNVADIDSNCKVDIFDYNTLVTNFGKHQ